MALPIAFLDELRTRTPLAPLIGRRARLERAGRQWKACCPFHDEKSPSLHIWDDHYHCFGCGAHGDAISFVMQSEGAGFMEAIERLAGDAGLEVPSLSPAAAEAERRRHDPVRGAGNRRRQLPAPAVPARRPCRAGLPSRPRPDPTTRSAASASAGPARARRPGSRPVPRRHHPGPAREAGLMRRDEETGRIYDHVLQPRDVPDPRPARRA